MLAKLKLILCSAATAMAIAMTQVPATAAEVDPEGTVTMAWAGPPASLDPHVVPGLADQLYMFFIYDRLTSIDQSGAIKPMLAKSWAVGADGKTLELQLRDDVFFQDGTRFDAAAVKANLERGKTIEGSTVKNALSSIESIEVKGDFDVALHLKPGLGGDLPALLATSAGAMISPKAIADGRDLRLAPGDAGSGPYMVTEFRPNDTAIYVRSPVKYWDKDAGKLKRIEVKFVGQAAARLNGVRAGQFDLAQILGNDMDAAKKLAQSGQVDAFEATTANVQALFLKADRPALNNPKLREAIAHAIDRQAISDAAFGGNCVVTDQPLLSTHWAYNPDLAQFSNYDPEKAAALVKESGIASPSFDLVFAPGTSWEPQANIVQGMLSKVGISAKLVPMPQQDGLTAFRNGQADALEYVTIATVDPSQQISTIYTGGYNIAPADVKAQVEQMAAKATDPAKTPEERAAIYRDIFKMSAEGVWIYPICASKHVWAHKKNIVGVEDARGFFAGLPDFRSIAVTK